MKNKYIKVPQEISGFWSSVVERPEGTLLSQQRWAIELGTKIWDWVQEHPQGSTIVFEVVELSDEEFNSLGKIEKV